MMQILKHPLAFILAALIWSAVPALAQQAPAGGPTPKPVGSFKSWDAYTFEDKGRLMCYTQGDPAGTIGKAPNRGKAAVMVIQAPDAAAKDQVSIVLGFVPQDGKPVTVTIGGKPGRGKKYTLKKFAVGRAWADSDKLDRQMVDAMKHYDWLVVNLVASSGAKVQDTYNLSGFGDAYDAAVKACK
jgi:invasion protein IalB